MCSHHRGLRRRPVCQRGGGGARLVVEAGEVLDVRVRGLGPQVELQGGGRVRRRGRELVLVAAALVADAAAAAHGARYAAAVAGHGRGVRAVRAVRGRAGPGAMSTPLVLLGGARPRL